MKPQKIIFLFLILLPLDLVLSRFVGQEYRYYDLFLLIIFYFSFHLPTVPLIYISSTAGIIKDILAGGAVGINGFTFPLIALISLTIISHLQIKRWYSFFLLAFILSILNTLLISILVWIFGINILHMSIFELIYLGLGNGIILTIVMLIPGLMNRKQRLTRSNHAWR